ncbi:MAG: hypothetical protein CW716_11130 [Candidatus Bathyarchaeum sp.]|nr:MAG: hypothetical protein CW716_11130 [Candidatus Bathyarchaeum sp.]
MSRSANKQVSSLAFRLQKTYERIINFKPSLFLVGMATVAASIFLLGGGLYDLLVQPDQAWFYGGRMIVFYPALNEQFLVGSILVMIFGAMGFAGFLIAYRSTKYASNPREAYRTLLVGCALLVIGYLLIENGLLSKFSL